MGLLDRRIKSGDIIRFEKEATKEHTYNIVYSHGSFQIGYEDLSRLFIKDFSKTVYCNSIHASGMNHQLHRLSEEEFYNLVNQKEFTAYIDEDVYTLKNYPASNPGEKIREILNTDVQTPALKQDSRFIRAICMQFEEITTLKR